MPYTKTPEQSSYKTTRFPLMGSFNSRNYQGLKDQRYINCFPESIKNPIDNKRRIYIVKRPGLAVSLSNTAGVGRGCFKWNGKIYQVIGSNLYSNTTIIQSLATSTGTVGFVPVNVASGQVLFVADGTNGYTVTTADVVTQVNPTYTAWVALTPYSLGTRRIPTVANSIFYEATTGGTSAGAQPTWPTVIGNTVVDGTVTWTAKGYYGGFPSPHIPTPVYLDGYVFLTPSNTDDIYNSDVNLPDSWNPSNFLSAEMYPDQIKGLVRQNNQIACFGENSLEFFFDASNASGSPIARNDGAAQHVGAVEMNTIQAREKNIYFVGATEVGGRAVWEIEAFKPMKISLEWVDQILDAEGTSISNAHSFLVRSNGHQFYGLVLTSRTLIYDIEEKMWHEWSSNSTGTDVTFNCNFACDGDGKPYFQHSSNGKLYIFDSNTYQDDSISILMTAITSLIDLDTVNRKFCNIFTLNCDRTSSASTITLYYSDDDYQTWSVGRILDLTKRAFCTRLGMFRRRAFKFVYTDNLPFRAETFEIETNMMVN